MKEKCKLYFVFYGHKLCKVNLINAIVWKKSSFKVDIRQNKKICYFMTPVGPVRGGQWVNLTGYLDSSHMVSQYLLTYSKALKPIIKET